MLAPGPSKSWDLAGGVGEHRTPSQSGFEGYRWTGRNLPAPLILPEARQVSSAAGAQEPTCVGDTENEAGRSLPVRIEGADMETLQPAGTTGGRRAGEQRPWGPSTIRLGARVARVCSLVNGMAQGLLSVWTMHCSHVRRQHRGQRVKGLRELFC